MKLGEQFKPDKALMRLYYTYLLMVDAIIFLAAVLPATITALVMLPLDQAPLVAAFLILPLLLIVGFAAFWIPRYFSSVFFIFTEAEIVVERGVWWKHKSTVPYNRVTNIDLTQGPISRRYGLATVHVQTAGYSATGAGGATAEAQIFGVKNYEEIKDLILNMARGLKPIAVEAAAEAPAPGETARQMLAELKKIREILENPP
jgi:membrane protein YdbS with pleckstrin-like domain